MKPTMNYDILKAAISATAKLAWHVFRDGVVSVFGLRDALQVSRARAHVIIKELLEHGFIIRIGFGYYRIAESLENEAQNLVNEPQSLENKTFPSVARTFLSNESNERRGDGFKNLYSKPSDASVEMGDEHHIFCRGGSDFIIFR